MRWNCWGPFPDDPTTTAATTTTTTTTFPPDPSSSLGAGDIAMYVGAAVVGLGLAGVGLWVIFKF